MKLVILIISAIFVVFMASTGINSEGAVSINIFSPESKPYGLSYEEHVENFWKHIISIPTDKNPWDQKTGENCAVGQSE